MSAKRLASCPEAPPRRLGLYVVSLIFNPLLLAKIWDHHPNQTEPPHLSAMSFACGAFLILGGGTFVIQVFWDLQ